MGQGFQAAARMMAAAVGSAKPGYGFCPNGCKRGFQVGRSGKRRDARKCARCKGAGFVPVGGTKR